MKYITLLFLLGIGSNLFSQRFFFQSFSTSEGLSQSQVTSITQDSIGYLWVGTLGGISKYNGNSFKNYSTDNGLLNNRINILKWIDSRLFIGHQGGISILDNDKITSYPFRSDFRMINVTNFIQFKNRIIITTNGAGLYEFKDRKLIKLQLLQDDFAFIRDVLEWKNDVYFATRGGVIRTTNLNELDHFLPQKEISISSLTVKNDNLLITSFYDGIFYYNKEKNKIVKSEFENKGFLFNHTLVDSRNNLWISTSNGVIKYDGKNYSFIDNSVGLPINVISTSFEDLDQNIWMGSQGKGLIKIAPGDIFYFDKSTGLESDVILSGFQTPNKIYYLGTMDGGVLKTTDFKSYKKIDINPTVWCAIADVDGKHWFGTKFGLYSVDHHDKTQLFDIDDGVPGFKITALYKINSNSMYIGGSHGVALYEHGKFKQIGENSIDVGTVRNITLFQNKLYIATDLGLFYLTQNNRFELIGQINKTVYSIAKINNSRLFFGTEDGLYELQNNNVIERIRFSMDVASNYINFINTNKDELIVGTNNGVYFINTTKNTKNVKRIGPSDGLIDPETNINSSFIDNNGKIWLGTSSGLVSININSINRTTETAKLKLLEILLNYEKFNYEKYNAKLINDIPQSMSFPYNKNNLQFNFDGVSVNNYEDLSFQFKIDGLDNVWMPMSKSSNLTLSGIPPGNYTLNARIIQENGNIVGTTQISFIIRQAFYKSWWFISIIITLIVGIVFLWMKFRIRREQMKNELERTEFKSRLITLEQQSLNASMNRHFIFNSLNSIQYFINISDKLSANKYLSNFAKLIRKNLDSSTEENSMVTLAEELERIELYLSLESMRFKDKFNHKIIVENVDLESILIPAMMIQPFVENSIIHGVLLRIDRKGDISITISNKENYILIDISDNGIGIEKSIEQKVAFTGDHKSQGMEITMKRIKIMKKLSGHHIELDGPKQMYDSDNNISGTTVLIKIYLNNLED